MTIDSDDPTKPPDVTATPENSGDPSPPSPVPTQTKRRPPVVGIGASAGGLDAFKKFFNAVPPDSGVAFVLVPHLDPRHASLMVKLIARHTPMPVVEAIDNLPVEANHVYVIPPDKYLTIAGGVLRLSGPVAPFGSATAIDLFLRSLADDQQDNAVCIILSGTGTHGSLGLRAVKAAGGMTMVQAPATADFSSMPQSALATGLADYVLPVEQLPAALITYVRHFYVNGDAVVKQGGETPDDLNQVLALLRTRTRFDFRCYRKAMLARRIERRMGLSHCENLADYLAHLRRLPDEVKQLVRDLFVSETRFFRDPEAFLALETEVIDPLVQAREPGAPLRVWVSGCATGEEAYSLAMLLLERREAAQKSCQIQIFATDLDEEALKVARQGVYPDTVSADVSPHRLARFFTRVNESSYQVSKELREPLVFAVQNPISDGPFSRIDLISCRDALFYVEPDEQQKAVPLLHFALNEGGYLFLGPSEAVGLPADLFLPLSQKWRIFRRIGPNRPARVAFPIVADAGPARQGAFRSPFHPVRVTGLGELTHRLVVEQLGPAAVVINRKHEILYFLGPTIRYLDLPPGEPTQDLLMMAREGLRPWLRAAVSKAIEGKETVVLTDVRILRGGAYHPITLTVKPMLAPPPAEGLLLVIFQDRAESVSAPPASPPLGQDSLIRQLEDELRATKEDLQTTIEELESANEELKTANEEATSMNEELRSTNEELETSKGELQSLNGELNTVNRQLHDKIQELEKTNNDVSNLLNCTDVATVFLDAEFRIKLFTPPATRLFNLIASDVGRPLGDVTSRFTDPDLFAAAQQVLHQFVPSEKEVSTADGSWWVRRVLPYRTRDDRIVGVVITFIDVTERKKAADQVVRRLAAIVESSADAIVSKGLDGTIRTWNRGAERLYGYAAEEAVGRSIQMTVPDDRAEEWAEVMSRLARGEHVEQLETERVRKDGRRLPVVVTYSPIHNADGKVVSASVIAHHVSEYKRAEQALRESEERLRAILNTAADAILTIDQRGMIQSVNAATVQMFGYAAGEMIGQHARMLMPSPYHDEHDAYLARYLQTQENHAIGGGREVHGRRKDGTVFPVDLAVSEIKDLKLFTGILRDVTRRKELEHEVVEIASLEQRRIGQDLHDSVGQELTALSILVGDLADTVRADPAAASALVERMARGLQRSQNELRAVLRGLLPVSVDTQGLMAALSDLADRIQSDGKVTCTFDCPEPVAVADNLTATHLYLIAQEAVRNAIRHGEPRNVRIFLRSNDLLVLGVQDDGIGMPAPSGEIRGLGLRIMRNRAAIIGATLTVEPAEPTGTVITCVLTRRKHERERHEESSANPDRR